MLNHLNVAIWSTIAVREWLSGLCDESKWLKSIEHFEANKLNGRKLLLMSPRDLDQLGASKVDLQERIAESIETLRIYSNNISKTTLQLSILRLATQARSLHQQLVANRTTVEYTSNGINKIHLSTDYKDPRSSSGKNRVRLDSLAQVSVLVRTVKDITAILNSKPFSQHKDYRSMKSLLLAISIELTSTAQRDQFVERPNDIIEKSSKTLADYCYKIVQGTNDLLLVEPFQLETVRIKKGSHNSDFGLTIKYVDDMHIVDKISPLSGAQRTNKLSEGDEIVQYNRCILGWTPKSVEKLVKEAANTDEIIVTIKRPPRVYKFTMNKEINKFLKKIHAEKSRGNKKECVELYNIVGGLYSEIGSYDEAIHYHEQALDLCKTLGDRTATALAYRHIGEAKAATGNFYQAIDYTKKYLDLAQRTCDKVEIQRAWTTLGRVYLMQAQDLRDKSYVADKVTKETAREAEKKFQKALSLAESVADQVDEKEYAQMTSGLWINLGLIKDICGQHADAVQKLIQASKICSEAKLKEDLHRCQAVLASMYRQRGNVKMAVRASEEALATAKSIRRKILICDSLIERGLAYILQRDFRNAKRTFAQAYLERSPNEEDHAKAIRLTKLAHLIGTSYERVSRDTTAGETRLRLCDKLGDLFVATNFYKLAIEYYRLAFADARLCQKPRSELARILYSLGETYADDGQLENALVCYDKELKLRSGNAGEQCQSLMKMAQICEQLEKEPEDVCEFYENALEKAGNDNKLIYIVSKEYVHYLDKYSLKPDRCKELETRMLHLKSLPEVTGADDQEEGDEEEASDFEDEVPNVDDIITDDDEDDEIKVTLGRRKTRGKFKPNEVGDTPLHEACIKGDRKRVESLIALGHEINPRDNAGWIPLHEACNHGHNEIVEYLIEHGADVNYRGLKGMTPLHDAATNGHFDIMRILMRNGANVIALTDSGETVLGCLRDYKKRNFGEMSNSELSEYKYIESELLNNMDKCGYSLMEENLKSLGKNQRKEPAPASHPKPKPSNISYLEPDHNAVQDYRATMGVLKRKRLPETYAPSKRSACPADLPATFSAEGLSTSASTKEWLANDADEDEDEEEENNFEVIDNLAPVAGPSNEAPSRNRSNREIITVLDSDDEFENDLVEINDLF